jgi:hypothetical protein
MQTVGTIETRLCQTMVAKQHAPTRLAPTGSESSRQKLGLVVAAAVRSAPTGGGPRDDIDLRWIDTATELVGQIANDATTITKLEPDNELLR